MKVRTLLIGVLTLFMGFSVIAQEQTEFKPSGKATGKVFFNYHYDMTDGEEQESSFEIKRAYLGYNYNIAKGLKASITLDVGKNDGGSDYTAYLKKAQLEWKASSAVKVSLGMISTIQFKEQEKFWGYRYIMKSFNDQYGFGPSADVGIKANFKLSDSFSANAFIINGEGYKKVQDEDGKQKVGASLIYKHKGLIAKAYADVLTTTLADEEGNETDVTSNTFAGFLGYEFSDQFRLGAEYNLLTNATNFSDLEEGKDMIGWSFYSTYTFNKKWEVFGRYDNLSSNKLEGEAEKWNLAKNGSAITTGVQYAPVRGVKMALNYQGYNFKDSNNEDNSLVFVNFEFKF
ncbi:porin family protein [Labilibaculum sp. DW002]|uniref:Porin family protein n=1 Tax=Paralabilibaculum antarcticum TaxID=2912572 RepID=A0ABT5VU13_9BACT|nr:outer membrane beta-barrel protein [Labilibaculum sp. DW002]MDE5418898.1 porin family protein [Labilibaculum sp. DW002]